LLKPGVAPAPQPAPVDAEASALASGGFSEQEIKEYQLRKPANPAVPSTRRSPADLNEFLKQKGGFDLPPPKNKSRPAITLAPGQT
jgi:hypothetical protein